MVYDQSIDIWAAGLILYEMVTGVHPFDLKGDYQTAKEFQESLIKEQNEHSGKNLRFPSNRFLS